MIEALEKALPMTLSVLYNADCSIDLIISIPKSDNILLGIPVLGCFVPYFQHDSDIILRTACINAIYDYAMA